jgi:VTC domain
MTIAGWPCKGGYLSRMTASIPSLRYELKFIANGRGLSEVLAFVKRHPSAFHETYPTRVVNNIYLDSPGRGDYHDHISGVGNRSKTRIRWYGEPCGLIERPTLERKIKRGLVSGKESHRLPAFSVNDGSVAAHFQATFSSATLPEMLQFALQHREPALFNRYQRHYFASGDGRFRLTVDSGLKFASPKANNFSLPAASRIVVELKFGIESAEDADLVTNAMPFRVARFSKYVAGIERMGTLTAVES